MPCSCVQGIVSEERDAIQKSAASGVAAIATIRNFAATRSYSRAVQCRACWVVAAQNQCVIADRFGQGEQRTYTVLFRRKTPALQHLAPTGYPNRLRAKKFIRFSI